MPTPFNLKRPVITRRHEGLIKANWRTVCLGTSAFDEATHGTPAKFFCATFYRMLFAAAPTVRPLFPIGHLGPRQGPRWAHAHFSKSSVALISSRRSKGLDHRHLKYGVGKDDYTVFVARHCWHIDEAYLTAFALVYNIMLPVLLTGEPAAVAECVLATITTSVPISATAKRVTFTLDFPLRHHPGDAIWLGLPVSPSVLLRRHFCIVSSLADTTSIDICVADTGGFGSHWLCTAPTGTPLHLFWVKSNVRLEIDTPQVLPTHVVFVSHGIGSIPLLVMLHGLCTVRDCFQGSVVSLQCAPSPDDVAPFNATFVPDAIDCWAASSRHYAPAVTSEYLDEIAPYLAHAVIYVCGPPSFAKDVEEARQKKPPRIVSLSTRLTTRPCTPRVRIPLTYAVVQIFQLGVQSMGSLLAPI
ncbi:Aste57867_23406 [Aphanomyces stellatus]|uniref:Aste57867_23406 protein n=1 Tax=Aphanomyces stellatus TaxID=120398 RepID=A0A485LMN7_9STRA|nr:hypothetical protein As57867_023335 [Aphanomyces stellatus]VFU00052.1 Aste57867_23406 [Aphanomyces stellatus]